METQKKNWVERNERWLLQAFLYGSLALFVAACIYFHYNPTVIG